MSKVTRYQEDLRSLIRWDEYLLEHSGLPGPRGNIELAQAVALEGTLELFQRYLNYSADIAPVNSPYEFLAFCGALGLGRLLAEGDIALLQTMRRLASDPRWRMREAVAMALQQLGGGYGTLDRGNAGMVPGHSPGTTGSCSCVV